jgi:hypothetical protein
MTERTLTRMSLCGLALTLGCDASTLVGQTTDGSAPDAPAIQASFTPVGTMGHTCAAPQFPGDHPFTTPTGLAGVWAGFVQGGVIGLSSDAVKLTMDQASDGTNQIHVVYGTAAPPPPATVATDYYPPGYQPYATMLIEGYSYLAHNVNWEAFGQQWRLRFRIQQSDPWGGWCRLQSSYVSQQINGPAFYTCAPNTGGFSTGPGGLGGNGAVASNCGLADGPGYRPWPCAQLDLCLLSMVCACDECGCDMPGNTFDGVPTGPDPNVLDLLFNGDSATGGNVQLMRAATN